MLSNGKDKLSDLDVMGYRSSCVFINYTKWALLCREINNAVLCVAFFKFIWDRAHLVFFYLVFRFAPKLKV